MWQYSANYTGVNDSAKMTKKMKKIVQEPRTAVSVKTMRQAPLGIGLWSINLWGGRHDLSPVSPLTRPRHFACQSSTRVAGLNDVHETNFDSYLFEI